MKLIILIITFCSFFSFIISTQNNIIYAADITGQGCSGDSCKLQNPIPSVTNPNELIGKIINGLLGIVGSVALVMFIYGGVMWMISGGNEAMVTKGKNTLMWAAIGLIVIFSAYAMVNFVLVNVLG